MMTVRTMNDAVHPFVVLLLSLRNTHTETLSHKWYFCSCCC